LRIQFFLILATLQIFAAWPVWGEVGDATDQSDAITEITEQGIEDGIEEVDGLIDDAQKLENSADEARALAEALRAAGKLDEAREKEALAAKLEKESKEKTDQAWEYAQQALAYAETSQDAADRSRIVTSNDETTDSELRPERLEQAKRKINPGGGWKKALENPIPGEEELFVCDNGKCRKGNGSKNIAAPNAAERYKAVDPDHTHLIGSVEDFEKAMELVPEGKPVRIFGHGAKDGLQINENLTVMPGTEEFYRVAEALKGHPVIFESCGLANVEGFCGGMAAITGTSVRAYDQIMYSELDGFYAKTETNEVTIRPQGSPRAPEEIVQQLVPAERLPALEPRINNSWTPPSQNHYSNYSAPASETFRTAALRVLSDSPPGTNMDTSWAAYFLTSANSAIALGLQREASSLSAPSVVETVSKTPQVEALKLEDRAGLASAASSNSHAAQEPTVTLSQEKPREGSIDGSTVTAEIVKTLKAYSEKITELIITGPKGLSAHSGNLKSRLDVRNVDIKPKHSKTNPFAGLLSGKNKLAP